jgi:signal transduction histidine kinase
VLKERADFEYMITSLSTRLINLMPSEADNELKSALKEISEFVKADRSYIFLVKDDGTYIESTNKWCIPEAKHLFNKPKNSSICEDYPYITGRLNSLDPVYFNDIGTMPEEAFRDKNSLMIHKIKSFACVPMVYNKKLKGFVGFDTIRSYKHWTEEEISLLRLAGDFFANSIEHQRTEEALIEEKVRAELYVDLMGHDINNMNQISLGYLELALDSMKNKTADMDDIRNYVMRSIDTIKNSSKLIDNVKKLQNEKLGQYEMKIMNIAGVMSEVRAHHCNSCDRDVRITFMPVEECYVMANVLLKDVFSNLIGNAIKHSTGPLEINIKVESIIQKGKRFYRVIVEDNGPGIPDDLKEKLFERLSLTKTKAAGKGFGLCLIKMIIDDFNGELMVEDRVSGEYRHGCRFIVELPAADLS